MAGRQNKTEMKHLHRPGFLLRLFGVGLGLWLVCAPAWAFQVKITAPHVQLKSRPDQRGPEIEKLGPQRAVLLDTAYGPDGELWCRIEVKSRHSGWVPARFLDPMLRDNLPLRLIDLPGALLFDHAQREVIYRSSLSDPALKGHLRRWTLVMEMALVKERWESKRQRLNFLEISRQVGVKISDAEYRSLQQELKVMEQKFQQVLTEWQHS